MFFDVETTGLDDKQNGIIQFAGIIEDNGVEVKRFNVKINPYSYNKEVVINDNALKVTNTTREMLETYSDSTQTFKSFKAFLDDFVDKFDKTDKIIPIGYNSTKFDIPFLQEWFIDNGEKYYGSYFEYKDIDVFALVKILSFQGKIKTENQKLETICNYFDIEINAHDAMSDILATKKLYEKLVSEYLK